MAGAPIQDNFLRGSVFLLAASLCFSLSDTMAKYITRSVPAIELATIRYVVFTALATSPFLHNRRLSLRSNRPGLQILRGLGIVGSALFFILALGRMPIAEATAINFINPLLITALAVPVLGESVRPQGWLAVSLGFVGMLVVVRPSAAGLPLSAGLVLASSLFWSVAMLVTRKLAGIDRTSVTLLWTSGTGLALLLMALPFYLAPISVTHVCLCLAVGIVASGGQWFAALAYRQSRASALAPLSDAQLIWSSALGFLVFGAAPDRFVLAGAVIIAVSGVYVVRLERLRTALAAPTGSTR